MAFAHRIERDANRLVRTVSIGDREFQSALPSQDETSDPSSEWWALMLRGKQPEFISGAPRREVIRLVDLFCGSGGFTTGFRMAAAALGVEVQVQLAVDTDADALTVYSANHRPTEVTSHSVMDLVDAQLFERDGDYRFFYPPEIDDAFARFIGKVDVVTAGPPCQGHSNLNNHTRREDPRNALYPIAAAMGLALGASAMLIENVPAVLNDRFRSVDVTKSLLAEAAWQCDDKVLAATKIGWPQTRRRHFLAASSGDKPIALAAIEAALASERRTLRWAIGDLLDATEDHFLDVPSRLSEENDKRVRFLQEQGEYTLPNELRPLKHRDGHTYPSSYGRLNWEEAAGTITTGFLTPGRGRFVHPDRPRALTPHEGARIQGFPDSYYFGDVDRPPARGSLAKWIGDAVPTPLGYAAAFSVLATLV